MNKILNELWENYFYEECSRIENNEIKDILSEADKIKSELNESLNERESELLETYLNKISEIDERFLRQTFEKGMCFAASFFLVVLGEK